MLTLVADKCTEDGKVLISKHSIHVTWRHAIINRTFIATTLIGWRNNVIEATFGWSIFHRSEVHKCAP